MKLTRSLGNDYAVTNVAFMEKSFVSFYSIKTKSVDPPSSITVPIGNNPDRLKFIQVTLNKDLIRWHVCYVMYNGTYSKKDNVYFCKGNTLLAGAFTSELVDWNFQLKSDCTPDSTYTVVSTLNPLKVSVTTISQIDLNTRSPVSCSTYFNRLIIGGITVGCILVILVALDICCRCKKSRKKQRRPIKDQSFAATQNWTTETCTAVVPSMRFGLLNPKQSSRNTSFAVTQTNKNDTTDVTTWRTPSKSGSLNQQSRTCISYPNTSAKGTIQLVQQPLVIQKNKMNGKIKPAKKAVS